MRGELIALSSLKIKERVAPRGVEQSISTLHLTKKDVWGSFEIT
jgi:hypothetical protein